MQQGLLEALELHTDYRPDCKTTISRLELGKAWPSLEIVRALAKLDATLEGGECQCQPVMSAARPCNVAGQGHLSTGDGGGHHVDLAPFDHQSAPCQMADDVATAHRERHRE